jgi:dual specificity tyrosine-phosphorylation-regulated kinase 2/3/4
VETPSNTEENGEFDVLVSEGTHDDAPDSPWTIEAVDSEMSDKEEEEVGLLV